MGRHATWPGSRLVTQTNVFLVRNVGSRFAVVDFTRRHLRFPASFPLLAQFAVSPDYPLDQPVFTDSVLQIGLRATRDDRCSGKMAAAAATAAAGS